MFDANSIFCSVGPALDALFSSLRAKNFTKAVEMCNAAITKMTEYRLKEPHSFLKDFFWIICSLLLAIRVFCECIISIQTPITVVEEEKRRLLCCSRLLRCIPLSMRIGNPADELMSILSGKIFMLTPAVQKAVTRTVLGAYHLLRASRNMKDQSILGAGSSFGHFYKEMGEDADCFELTVSPKKDSQQKDSQKKDSQKKDFKKKDSQRKDAEQKDQEDAEKQEKDAYRSDLLRMFSPGINRKIAEGLLDNLASCSAMVDAIIKDETKSIIECATLGASDPPRCSFVDASVTHLEDDEKLLQEAKRMLTADFSGFNFIVQQAIYLKFNASKISSDVLEKVKEALEGCTGDDDDAESESEESGFMSKVVDKFTPEALKKLLPAVMTVVQICSKDVPAIKRKLTNEYFVNREKRFEVLRSEENCQEQGIPFNPGQLAEPETYVGITKTVSNDLMMKYSTQNYFHYFILCIACANTNTVKIVVEKADKELGTPKDSVLSYFKRLLTSYNRRCSHSFAYFSCGDFILCFDKIFRSNRQ
jgi:hypothetical protein